MPEGADEIEVSSEMIKAGADFLNPIIEGAYSPEISVSVEPFLQELFQIMSAARPTQSK